MCKDVVIATALMQSHIENGLHEDVQLQSKLQHALEISMDEHENVEVPSQSNIKPIMAYVEVGGSKILKSTLFNKLNGTPSLFEI